MATGNLLPTGSTGNGPAVFAGTQTGAQFCSGNNDGSFGACANAAGNGGTTAVATADFNLDGYTDMVMAGTGNQRQLQVLLTDPLTGILSQVPLTLKSSLPNGGQGVGPVAVTGDFNGDGFPDIASTDGESVAVFLSNGDGTFKEVDSELVTGGEAAGLPYSIYPLSGLSMAVADFDGDGKLDLAVTSNVYGGGFTILHGGGDGHFTGWNVTGFSNPAPPLSYSITAADINGDGKPDVVVADKTAGTVTVYLAPDFVQYPLIQYSIAAPTAITAADFNNDGIPDLAVTGSGPNGGGMVTILMGHPTLGVSLAPITGVVYQGQNGVTSATVTNGGANGVTGTFSVTLGGGLFGVSGNGWNCGGGSVCNQNVTLAAGASLQPAALGFTPGAGAGTATAALRFNGVLKDTASIAIQPLPFPITVNAVPQSTAFYGRQADATYLFTANNSGVSAFPGPFTLTNSAPAGFTAVSMGGPGWACVAATTTCTRSDSMPALSGFPPVTLVMSAPASAGASVTDSVTLANSSWAIGSGSTVAFTASPLLTFSVATTSPVYSQGQKNVTFTLNVKNTGSSGTQGPITVQNNPGTGLIPVSLAGSGWICTAAGLCTNNQSISPGFSLSSLQFTANVSGTAGSTVTESAGLHYLSTDGLKTAFSSSAGATAAVNQANLVMRVSHTGAFVPAARPPGHRGAKCRHDTSYATVTVTDTLPPTVTATNIAGAGWTCTLSPLSCTRADPLSPAFSYPPISVSVVLSANPLLSLTDTATLSGVGPTPFSVSETAALGALTQVTLAAPSPAAQTVGQPVTFTVNVTPQGSYNIPTGSVVFLDNEKVLGERLSRIKRVR